VRGKPDPGLRVEAQHACSPGGAQHANRPLVALAIADIDRAGRRGPGWRERQEVGRAYLNGIRRRRAAAKGNVHSGKLLEKACRRFDQAVNACANVGGANSVAIAVLEDAEGKSASLLIEPKGDGRATSDGLQPRQPEAPSQVPGSTIATRVIG